MEDYDIFTNKIEFTKTLYKNTLWKLVHDNPSTPIGPNYQSGRKLLAEECFSRGEEMECAFHLSEAVSSHIRTMATYRDEQLRAADDKRQKIVPYLQTTKDLIPGNLTAPPELESMWGECQEMVEAPIEDELPFHKQYLKFSPMNNNENLKKILGELPEEWTIVQLTTPYNPNENLLSIEEYREEVDSIYLTVFTNHYLGDHSPFTLSLPANVTKEGEKPLFTELYSILDENYKTIDKAQLLNNKKMVQNYWARREDVDLRMKSVINVMEKEWIGGWGSLLTGKLVDDALRDRVKNLVDNAITDWGFIKLTSKQRILLYNLLESSPVLTSQQSKSCLRLILTQHGDVNEARSVLQPCSGCSPHFDCLAELCLDCLANVFQRVHHFTVVDGIKAFSQVMATLRDSEDGRALKNARRHPVLLIVDETLDTFPWESLPILNEQAVSRIENVHMLYHLYKTHEKRIRRGRFVTSGETGRYVINPENNLDRMEKRMRAFVEYWCPQWQGTTSAAPPPDVLLSYLRADVFLYCGHGDGGADAAAGVRALCVLAGCGSARLSAGARRPPRAAHRRLLVAGAPTLVGMLWEVTDLEVDKVVTALLALLLPSTAPVPWTQVGKAEWSRGQLEVEPGGSKPVLRHPELGRAVCVARRCTQYMMIASSVVVRGLPVMIDPEELRGEL